MSNEWAHDAARKGVPTEMKNLVHDGHVLMNASGRVPAGSAGACLRGAVPALLVQDRSDLAPARSTVCTQIVVARPRTLQKNPFMTRGAGITGASSGPHRAWDPV